MSAPMEKALENIDSVFDKADESAKERLEAARKVISQNRKKIWLRTKAGKPVAEKTEAITEKLESEMESALEELEAQVAKIKEESRRRSMVVT
jgi:hypothetical protein